MPSETLFANMKKANDSSAKKSWPAQAWTVAIYGASGLFLFAAASNMLAVFDFAGADENIWKRTNFLFSFMTEGAVRLSASLVELIVVVYLAISVRQFPKAALPLWLTIVFGVYRYIAWELNFYCGCSLNSGGNAWGNILPFIAFGLCAATAWFAALTARFSTGKNEL